MKLLTHKQIKSNKSHFLDFLSFSDNIKSPPVYRLYSRFCSTCFSSLLSVCLLPVRSTARYLGAIPTSQTNTWRISARNEAAREIPRRREQFPFASFTLSYKRKQTRVRKNPPQCSMCKISTDSLLWICAVMQLVLPCVQAAYLTNSSVLLQTSVAALFH